MNLLVKKYFVFKKKKIVKEELKEVVCQPYFDRVWLYYSIEFETKVFDLKEDLFDCIHTLFFYLVRSLKIPINKVFKLLKDEDGGATLVSIKKAFMDVYDEEIKSSESLNSFLEEGNEMTLLKEAEKKRGISYFFDDCIANLERERLNDQHFVSLEYDEIKNYMFNLFLDKNRETINIKELRNLATQLNYLVKIIPGVMD